MEKLETAPMVNNFCDNSEVAETALAIDVDKEAPISPFHPWKRVLGKHEGEICFVAFIANGSQAVSYSEDGQIKLWDVRAGMCLRTMTNPGEGYSRKIRCASLSPNENLIVTASGGKCLRVWDLRTGNAVKIIENPHGNSEIVDVAFSTVDDAIVASASDTEIKLWNIDSGKCLRTLKAGDRVGSIAFSPCGRKLAAGENEIVILWDVVIGERLQELKGKGEFKAIAFSPDGRRLIAGSFKGVQVWDVETATFVQTIKAWGTWMAITRDGQILLEDYEEITSWDLNTGTQTMTFPIPSARATVFSLSLDGTQLLCGTENGVLVLFTFDRSRPCRAVPVKDTIDSLCFSPDGSFFASGDSYRNLQITNVDTGEIAYEFQESVGQGGKFCSIAFSADNTQIGAGFAGGIVYLWSLGEELTLLNEFHFQVHYICSITFSLDGKWLIAGCNNGLIIVLVISSGDTLHTLRGHESWVSAVKVTPSASNFLHSFDKSGVKKVWDLETGECIETTTGQRNIEEDKVMETRDYRICSANGTLHITHKHDESRLPLSIGSFCGRFAFHDERAILAFESVRNITFLRVDAVMDSLKETPEGFVPCWYLVDLIEKSQFDQLVDILSDEPTSISNNQWSYHSDNSKSIFLVLYDKGKVDVMKQLLAMESSSCHFYRADTVLNYIMQSSHVWKDEAFEAILAYFSSRAVNQSLPAFDDETFFDCLATAAKDPSLRPKVVTFLASTPLKQAHKAVATGFTNGTAKFGDSLILAPSPYIDAPGIWKREADEGKLPITGEKNFSEFLVTPFPNIVQSRLIDTLVELNLTELFDTILVRSVMDYGWKQTRRGYIRDTWIYFFFLAMLSTFSILFQQIGENDRNAAAFLDPDKGTAFATMIVGIVALILDPAYTLAQELLQMRGFGVRTYFSDWWNWLDLLRVAFCAALIPLVLLDEQQPAQVVLAIALYLRWFGFLFYFQAFSATGHLVRMIIQITIDIRYLLMILVMSILAASFAFNTLQPPSTPPAQQQQLNTILFDFFNILILNNGYEPTELVYAGYPALRIILFIISMIFVPIILLNLLIALMSDSFERIQDKAFVELNLLRARIIKEQEYNLFNLFRRKQDAAKERFLHVMVPKGCNTSRVTIGEYQGVLNAMKRHTSDAAAGLEQKTKEEIANIRADVKAQLEEVRASVRADVKAQLDTVSTQLNELKEWMQANVAHQEHV